MMSKLLIAVGLALCLFFAGNLIAQTTLSLGPRVGLNYSYQVGDDIKTDGKTGLVVGLTSTYSINEKSGLGIDLLYSSEGSTNRLNDFKTNLNYLRIPITFQFFSRSWEDDFRPKAYAGVAPAFLLSADYNGDDIEDRISAFDLAAVFGVGFNYRLTASGVWLNTDLRFIPGLTKVPEGDDPADIINQSLQLSVGVVFGLGVK